MILLGQFFINFNLLHIGKIAQCSICRRNVKLFVYLIGMMFLFSFQVLLLYLKIVIVVRMMNLVVGP